MIAEKNKRLIYYAVKTGNSRGVVSSYTWADLAQLDWEDLPSSEQLSYLRDSDGNLTGEIQNTYGTATALKLNIQAKKASSSPTAAGVKADYSYVGITDDMNCPINLDTKVWFGVSTTNEANLVCVGRQENLRTITLYFEAVKRA